MKQFIIKEKVIDNDLCDAILDEELEWVKHSWYSYNQAGDFTMGSYQDKELDVVFDEHIPSTYKNKVLSAIQQSWMMYMMSLPSLLGYQETPMFNMINAWSGIRLNRYNIGTMMRTHIDHIDSLFDGKNRGIPILSVVGALNDCSEYEGGTLKFWDNYEVPLKKGEIVMFPSCFMYPHGVEEIRKGTRYTFVCWGY